MVPVPIYTAEEALGSILQRKPLDLNQVSALQQERVLKIFGEALSPREAVQRILESVRTQGDIALLDWTARLDGVVVDSPKALEVPAAELDHALCSLEKTEPSLYEALHIAARRIAAFHEEQPVNSWFTTKLGGQVGQLVRPLQAVGFYVPGGNAALPSTALMTMIPAIVAGCRRFVVTSPPSRESNDISPVTLAACALCKQMLEERHRHALTKRDEALSFQVFRLGGAQAIGAMAYGTQTLPRVDKIVGPGNLYVTLAKREVYGICDIDGIYGPTEAIVVADAFANAELVAADLLAQAEHDEAAIPILLTPTRTFAEKVREALHRQLASLPTAAARQRAQHAIQRQGGLVVCDDLEACAKLCSDFAAEHVSLSVNQPWDLVSRIHHAGGIFVGESSGEVLGDYVAGPSHVMPTGGSARYASPINVWDFVKITSVIALDKSTAREVAAAAEKIAAAERLDAHASAAKQRLQKDS
jgi:histidinol dehydrogenase